MAGADAIIWEGVERLAGFAKLDRGPIGAAIARRLIETFQHNKPPHAFAHLRFELEDVVRRWDASQELGK